MAKKRPPAKTAGRGLKISHGTISIVALAVALIGGASACRRRSALQPPPPPPTAVSTEAVAKQRAAGASDTPGERFDLSYDSTVMISGKSLLVRLQGSLVTSSPWKLDEQRWRSYRIAEPQVELSSDGQHRMVPSGAGEPFAIRWAENGEIEEVAFAASVAAETRQLIQAIATYLQVVCRQGKTNRSRWTTSERDATGKYEARYERTGVEWIKKTKLRYTNPLFPMKFERSEINYRGGCSDSPREVAGVEVVASDALGLRAHSSLTLRHRSGMGSLPVTIVGRLPAGYERSRPGVALPAASPAPLTPEQAAMRLGPALAELDASSSSSLPRKTLSALGPRLRDHPDELSAVEADFRRAPAHRKALSQLLVETDSPRSRELVDRLLEDESLPDQARRDLLTQLLWAPSAHVTTIDRVHALASRDVGALAAVAANTEGALLSIAQKRGGADLRPLVARYVEASRRAASGRRRSAYLSGLAYVGGDLALAALHEAAESEDSDLRLNAVDALEGLKDRHADDWIAERLKRDDVETVRERAARACGYRATRTCRRAVEGALAADRSERVRLRAVAALVESGGSSDDRALRRAVRSDRSPVVKEAAKRALDRLAARKHGTTALASTSRAIGNPTWR